MLNLKSLVVMTVYVEPAQFSVNLSYMYDFSLMAGFLYVMENSLYFDVIPVCISKSQVIKISRHQISIIKENH